jgi:hypothetical protein
MRAMTFHDFLSFQQVFVHASAISGMDRYEILLQLRGHVESGALHPIGRRWMSSGSMVGIKPVLWLCYELDFDSRNEGECIARKRNDDSRCSGPMLGFTAIRFSHEEILELWPDRSDPQTPPKRSPKLPFSAKRAKEIFTAILEKEPDILQDDAIQKYRNTMKAEGRIGGGNDVLRPIFKKVLGPRERRAPASTQKYFRLNIPPKFFILRNSLFRHLRFRGNYPPPFSARRSGRGS